MSGMLRAFSFAWCFLFLAALIEAQDSRPLPTTSPSTEAAKTEAYRFSVQVQRVLLDVVVTDANGNPVAGLNKDDFKVMEDGVVQQVRSFDAHTAAAETASQRPLDIQLPPDTFSNLTLAPPDKPVTVVLYDALHTPEDALPFAHQQLAKFIKDRKASTQVAVFVLTDRLHMLQGFTDDETRLMQAIDSKEATSQTRTLKNAPLTDDLFDTALVTAEIEERIHLAKQRNRVTVDAFIEIARFLSALPGRKHLIWMSGSFPAELFPDHSQFAGDARLDADIRSAQDLMRESRVAVYPVDVRGLRADPRFSAASRLIGPSFMPQPNFFGLGQAGAHAAMDTIAQSTGGRAFYNTNGLEDAMEAAVREGSEYYTLTYAPTNPRQDGAERRVKVVLTSPSYKLSYRTRYFAPDAAHPAPERPLVVDANMQHGAPNSSELFFEAKVVPVGGVMPASADEAEALKKFSSGMPEGKVAKPAPRSVRHYDISFAILGRLLQMPPADGGRYSTSMRFALAAYAQGGERLNGAEISMRNLISEAQYQKIALEGYHASMVFAVPEGSTYLRMAVRDEIGNRTGTMEIPLPVPAVDDGRSSAKP